MFAEDFAEKLSSLQDTRPSSNDGKNIVAPFLELFQEFLESLTTKFDHFIEEMIAINKTKDELICKAKIVLI